MSLKSMDSNCLSTEPFTLNVVEGSVSLDPELSEDALAFQKFLHKKKDNFKLH